MKFEKIVAVVSLHSHKDFCPLRSTLTGKRRISTLFILSNDEGYYFCLTDSLYELDILLIFLFTITHSYL